MYVYKVKQIDMATLEIKTENKIKEFRNYIYRKALQFGEDLMPCDVVDIIWKANRSGKFKDCLSRKYWIWRLELLIDVYESCGFIFPEEHKELTRENTQEYF